MRKELAEQRRASANLPGIGFDGLRRSLTRWRHDRPGRGPQQAPGHGRAHRRRDPQGRLPAAAHHAGGAGRDRAALPGGRRSDDPRAHPRRRPRAHARPRPARPTPSTRCTRPPTSSCSCPPAAACTTRSSERLKVLDAQPDSCSLTMGTTNFGDDVFSNPWPFITDLYRLSQEREVVPEFELFDLGHVAALHRLLDRFGLPYGGRVHVDLVMGVPGGMPGTADALVAAVNALPDEVTSWSATGIGRSTLAVALAALSQGRPPAGRHGGRAHPGQGRARSSTTSSWSAGRRPGGSPAHPDDPGRGAGPAPDRRRLRLATVGWLLDRLLDPAPVLGRVAVAVPVAVPVALCRPRPFAGTMLSAIPSGRAPTAASRPSEVRSWSLLVLALPDHHDRAVDLGGDQRRVGDRQQRRRVDDHDVVLRPHVARAAGPSRATAAARPGWAAGCRW